MAAHIIKIKDINGEMKIYSDASLHNEYLPRENETSVYVQVKMRHEKCRVEDQNLCLDLSQGFMQSF